MIFIIGKQVFSHYYKKRDELKNLSLSLKTAKFLNSMLKVFVFYTFSTSQGKIYVKFVVLTFIFSPALAGLLPQVSLYPGVQQ